MKKTCEKCKYFKSKRVSTPTKVGSSTINRTQNTGIELVLREGPEERKTGMATICQNEKVKEQDLVRGEWHREFNDSYDKRTDDEKIKTGQVFVYTGDKCPKFEAKE